MPILEGTIDISHKGKTYIEVCKLRRNNVFLTMEDIAKEVGVSRQRVRAILLKEKLPTKSVTKRTAVYCKVCKNPTPNGQVVCPGKCREEHYYTYVECRTCNRKIRYLKSYMKTRIKFGMNRYFYCSRECFYMGRRDGIS